VVWRTTALANHSNNAEKGVTTTATTPPISHLRPQRPKNLNSSGKRQRIEREREREGERGRGVSRTNV